MSGNGGDVLLDIRDLRVTFAVDGVRVPAVDGVSIMVRRGATVCVVGESGCGKTVTALSILRLVPEPAGRIERGVVLFEGRDLLTLDEGELRRVRGRLISMVFQEPVSSLNPVFTVGEQVAEALRTHGVVPRSEEKGRVVELFRMVGIPDPERRYDSYPHQLSGGMCQRVMIAMALACGPKLIVADEPTTALDVTIQAAILGLLDDLKSSLGMSLLLITHDFGIVAQMADEVYVMYAGKVVEHAPVGEIFANPRHPYTVGLLESLPTMVGERKRGLKAIPGTVPPLNALPQGCRFRDRCPLAEARCAESEPPLIEVGPLHSSACFFWERVEGGRSRG